MSAISLSVLDSPGDLQWCRAMICAHHYLHTYPDPRTLPIAVGIWVEGIGRVGAFVLGRPESTKFRGWYGSVSDVTDGYAEVTRWQVLNLSRVWLSPSVQIGGLYYDPAYLPGYTDRSGRWRSALASTAIRTLLPLVNELYLIRRPPVWLDQPYLLRYLLSYCNTKLHRGIIYHAAGFERFCKNRAGIETWRIRLPEPTESLHMRLAHASAHCPRAQRIRAQQVVSGQASLF